MYSLLSKISGVFDGPKQKVQDIDNDLKKHLAYRCVRTISYWALLAVGHVLAFSWMVFGTVLQGGSDDAAVIEEEERSRHGFIMDEQEDSSDLSCN